MVQIPHASNAQSTSTDTENIEGRKDGHETPHDKSLNEHTPIATLDHLTDS